MTNANSRKDEKMATLYKLRHELIEERVREHVKLYHRASVTTITRAVIDQVLEQVQEDLLKDQDQLEENGMYNAIDFIKQTTRDPELRNQFYRRYGC